MVNSKKKVYTIIFWLLYILTNIYIIYMELAGGDGWWGRRREKGGRRSCRVTGGAAGEK
jgi:hypothetical protein